MQSTTVNEVVKALDTITGGRVVTDISQLTAGTNPFVVMKSSNIPGKSVLEIPGLIFGHPDQVVRKVAVTMTHTESCIELAGATGVDLIIAHHPVADAANSGGVPLKYYLSLYNLAVIELHEAFHGLHPGIPFLHCHRTFRVEIAYGGIPGNILFAGRVLPEIKTAGDIIQRLNTFMGTSEEARLLEEEQVLRQCPEIRETSLEAKAELLTGTPDSPVNQVLHIFPHTGFNLHHLEQALKEHPETDTLIASISRVKAASPLAARAKESGLNFIVGNSHAVEILENGIPLAYAVKNFYLPSKWSSSANGLPQSPWNRQGTLLFGDTPGKWRICTCSANALKQKGKPGK